MICAYPQTWMFYGFGILVVVAICAFLGHFYRKATQNTAEARQWRWSSEDSRDMWIDVAKTMISAAGIAAALLAALATHTNNSLSTLVARSIRIATISLVLCVCVSMVLVLALARGHESAKSREQSKHPDKAVTAGPLSDLSLSVTLLAGFFALSSFFIGFLFLARIVWHI